MPTRRYCLHFLEGVADLNRRAASLLAKLCSSMGREVCTLQAEES